MSKRRRFIIPTAKKAKRALSRDQKDKLLQYVPKLAGDRRALDYWAFSYYCVGMNFTDMAFMKWSDIEGQTLTYYRRKTSTTETEQIPIVVHLRKEALLILKRQGKGEKYVFGKMDGTESPQQVKNIVWQWIKRTNKRLKRICEDDLKIPVVTTYTARHTAATMLLRAKTDIIGIRDALGHASIKTTEGYLSSINVEERRKMVARL